LSHFQPQSFPKNPFCNKRRDVLIPGGEPASAGRSYTAADYESMSYEEVASLFHIKD
tara:strand:- start:82882 stop:83052 length:171 start_codon:yes stop_codon:yes gene_type:complete